MFSILQIVPQNTKGKSTTKFILHKVSITLIPKPDKNTTAKQASVNFSVEMSKIFSIKYMQIKVKNTFRGSYIMTQ